MVTFRPRRLGRFRNVVATNTRGTKEYDNLVFSEVSTTEFTGRWGAFDMVREFNITTQEALEIFTRAAGCVSVPLSSYV